MVIMRDNGVGSVHHGMGCLDSCQFLPIEWLILDSSPNLRCKLIVFDLKWIQKALPITLDRSNKF